jgi:hypothetical protein
MGALHPGAWLAPSLALLLGPAPLVLAGIVALPLLLLFTWSRRLTEPKQDRLLGTFAVPAAVLLVLSIWMFSAMGDSWLLSRLKDDAPPRYEMVIPPGTAQVQLGRPQSLVPGDRPILQNHGAVLFRLREMYPSSTDRRAHSLRLTVRLREDGTVDQVVIADATDPALERAVRVVAAEMVFVPLVVSGPNAWVRMDVRYGT